MPFLHSSDPFVTLTGNIVSEEESESASREMVQGAGWSDGEEDGEHGEDGGGVAENDDGDGEERQTVSNAVMGPRVCI
jgi:hypothetical protein